MLGQTYCLIFRAFRNIQKVLKKKCYGAIVYLPLKGYASLDVGMMGVGQCPVTALDSNKLEEEAEVEKDSIEEISGMITNSFFFQFID